jgi:hypothetical protein
MIAAVIDIALARPWAVAVVAAVVEEERTRPPLTTTTMTVGVPLVAIALAAMTTADAHRLVSFTTGVMEEEDLVAPRRVAVWEGPMSMAHRVPVTLPILTKLEPDRLPVAMTTLT